MINTDSYYFFVRHIKKIMPSNTRSIISKILARFRLRAMGGVLRALKKRGIRLAELDALELFAKNGEFHTIEYAPHVKTVEAWEIDPSCEISLKRNLPKAIVKITDSFKEIRWTKKKFNFIVVDAPEGIYGKNNEYCEQFDIFPSIFKTIEEWALVIVTTFPRLDRSVFAKFPYLKNIVTDDHLRRRMLFYKIKNPRNISFDKIMAAHKRIIEKKGFQLEWYFFERRNIAHSYLVLKVKRSK